MLSLLSSVADVLAPPSPLDEELAWRWAAVTNAYLDKESSNSQREPVELTPIPGHLIAINRIIEQEEADQLKTPSSGAIGSCIEYLFQHKLLDAISRLAAGDRPPGMCREALKFFARLISRSKLELLPHAAVYSSTQKLILLCGRLPAGPYERAEVEFLSAVVDKIVGHPDYINCFLPDSFPMINALLALIRSPDSDIATMAGDVLIKLASTINEKASLIATRETPFCSKIVGHLVELYQQVPTSLKIDDIEMAIAWCFGRHNDDETGHDEGNGPTFSPAVRKFLCFLRWFILFDMIMYHLPEQASFMLTNSLLLHFRTEFLDGCVWPDLTGSGYADEDDADQHSLLTTAIVANCLRHANSRLVAVAVGEFLLVETGQPSTGNDVLKELLISRCRLTGVELKKMPEQVKMRKIDLCKATMQLFEELLNKPAKSVLETLVLNQLNGRRYVESHYDHVNGEGEEPNSNEFQPLQAFINSQSSPASPPPSSSVTTSSTQDHHHIHRVLQFFLSLVPDELKSDFSDQLGYESYIREAQRHYLECLSWPAIDPPITNSPQTSVTIEQEEESLFQEGNFLRMVLDNLESMIDLPYEVNLQVTSLITKLSLWPDHRLTDYLLDPTIRPAPGVRTLFSVLHQLVDRLQVAVKGVPELRFNLTKTRQQLLGERVEDEEDQASDGGGKQLAAGELQLIEAIIVIEEFCKELAAVALVKYNGAR